MWGKKGGSEVVKKHGKEEKEETTSILAPKTKTIFSCMLIHNSLTNIGTSL